MSQYEGDSYQPVVGRSTWAVGFIYFAAVILILTGVFQTLNGIVAVANKTYFVVGHNYTYRFNVTTWGWIHIVLGVLLVLAGIGVLSDNVVARVVAIILASLSAIANFMWLPYSPALAIVLIAFDFAVIWALAVHGRDIKET
jgi:hypothetical protein